MQPQSPPRWNQYTGVLHVHTDRSGGGGTIEEIVEAAKSRSVDFVVVTDRGTRGHAWDGKEGWHDDVLILFGEEVAASHGHFLAFETNSDVGPDLGTEAALEEVHRQVGVAVSVHAQLAERYPTIAPSCHLDFKHADAIEIWSFYDEFLASVDGRTVMQSSSRPDRVIKGPSRKILNRWDVELGRRRAPVVGGLNVAPRKAPLLEWRTLFPYKTAFATVQTIILARELPRIPARARDMVWEALREGRSFIANASINPPRGFQFYWVDRRGKQRFMGEDAEFESGGRLQVILPTEAEVAIRHNGQPLFWGTGEEIDFPAPTPGSYRVEVRLNRRLWILSNAIRLLEDNRPVQPTVSDFT
ncbi:MAG: hypothetical protein SF028_06170 [Candidatus Sumerlaeia bacterium]|nr:hypothetical protein [Candidatus Sumerlaeia bacterium]